jgi:hypothetical protein
MVRKASFAAQNTRAEMFYLNDAQGKRSLELTMKMETGLKQYYEYILSQRHITNGIDEVLARRLVNTMVTRHKRVLYRRSRQEKWAIRQVEPRASGIKASRKPWNHVPHTPQPLEPKSIVPQKVAKPTPNQNTPPQQDGPTTVNVATYRKLPTPSQISKATSAPFRQNHHQLMPPRPQPSGIVNELVCPYCCLILPTKEVSSDAVWA